MEYVQQNSNKYKYIINANEWNQCSIGYELKGNADCSGSDLDLLCLPSGVQWLNDKVSKRTMQEKMMVKLL